MSTNALLEALGKPPERATLRGLLSSLREGCSADELEADIQRLLNKLRGAGQKLRRDIEKSSTLHPDVRQLFSVTLGLYASLEETRLTADLHQGWALVFENSKRLLRIFPG